jgi:hypothetical protein
MVPEKIAVCVSQNLYIIPKIVSLYKQTNQLHGVEPFLRS